MHKKIFNYLWQNKNIEPVGRKIFLQKIKRRTQHERTSGTQLIHETKTLLKSKTT